MTRDDVVHQMKMCRSPSPATSSLIAALFFLAWFASTGEGIIVPSGKVGPITPYRSTPRPTPAPGQPLRAPAPVVEYSQDNPEPPPLDPSYVPTSYKTLSALSGNSIFYIPIRIRNIHGYQGANYYDNVQRNDPAGGGGGLIQPPLETQPKFVTWKGTYAGVSSSSDPHDNQPPLPPIQVGIPIPVQELDYSFPRKQQQQQYYQQQIRPIVVAPPPPNHFQPHQQDKESYNKKKKHVHQDNSQYSSTTNRYYQPTQQYPKKYNNNHPPSNSKHYYYYVKHDQQQQQQQRYR